MALKAQSRPRGLFGSFLFASLLAIFVCGFLTATPVQAKTPYEYVDSSEGDPGDGVLRPIPRIVDPVPVPNHHASHLFNSLVFYGGSRFDQSYLLLPLVFYGEIFPAGTDGMRQIENRSRILLPEGRWQNAP